MDIQQEIMQLVIESLKNLYEFDVNEKAIQITETRKEFSGDITVMVFPFLKASKKGPEETGEDIGHYISDKLESISGYNVVKGFLNLEIKDEVWLKTFNQIIEDEKFGTYPLNGKKVVLEYCGPNTNKPLHFGHVRNMMIGFSTANILSAAGYEVHKVNILNDRGIAICKSMLGWKKFGEGATPESTDKKGDHFVGDYYVAYANQERKEIEELVKNGMDKKEAERASDILTEAREMLLKWEDGDEDTLALWNKMNTWVIDGHNETYNRIGVDFEKDYKESDHYLLGKAIVEEGLANNIFYKNEDGSIWIDLSDEGLDNKLLLRSDGTSVYLTQDLGIAQERAKEYSLGKEDLSIYVVGDEQNYHFKVLQKTLQRLGKDYAEGIHHQGYGMVDLPGGAKMKSREGTSVDADELMDEMVKKAGEAAEELGKIAELSQTDKELLFEQIGLGAMKYFILKVNPKKRMIFDPEKSIDLVGHTGPFIQYSYARINSLCKKAELDESEITIETLEASEKELIKLLANYPNKVQAAAQQYDPSEIANYAYELAKLYNKFYAELPILNAPEKAQQHFRVMLSKQVAKVLHKAMTLLGIELPERM